jgi:Flp pilus assembly protein TadG
MRMRSSIQAIHVERGSQLVELAMVLPVLLVLTAGVVDFARAWNARQILANAAREGTRLGISQPTSDLDNNNPPSIQQICQSVADYLSAQNMSLAFMNNVANLGTNSTNVQGICSTPGVMPSPTCAGTGGCVPSGWTYYSTEPSGTYGLTIERNVGIPPSGDSTCGPGTGIACMTSTRVTLLYPYNWSFGFNHVINLFGGSSSYASTIPIQVYSTMANLAGG